MWETLKKENRNSFLAIPWASAEPYLVPSYFLPVWRLCIKTSLISGKSLSIHSHHFPQRSYLKRELLAERLCAYSKSGIRHTGSITLRGRCWCRSTTCSVWATDLGYTPPLLLNSWSCFQCGLQSINSFTEQCQAFREQSLPYADQRNNSFTFLKLPL